MFQLQGRRSRRNSITEADSQLTVENFGGSQDNLNKLVITRNPDKQPAIVTDATSSPIRYVRRQNSEDPPDYYNHNNEPSNSADKRPSEGHYSRINDRKDASLQRLSSAGGNGDVVFYGKKKFNHPVEDANQDYYDRGQTQEEEGRRLSQSGSQGNVTVYVMGQQGVDTGSFQGK